MKAFLRVCRSLLEKSQIDNEGNYTSTPNHMEARYEKNSSYLTISLSSSSSVNLLS